MQISTKFTIAIHILAAVEYFGKEEKVTSDFLASSIGFLYAAVVSQLISYSLFIPVSVYYADARMQCGDKARGQAMMALVPTLSNAVGALLGGFLLRASGVHGMLLFCLICSCVGSVIMIAGVEKVQ